MATLSSIRSPGVYIQELPAGSRPIEGVGTAIAAFVGITADGPYDQAIKVANWGQYTATFGTWVEGAYLPNAVYQYFNNGGGSAYITRIGSLSSDEGARASAELTYCAEVVAATYQAMGLLDGRRPTNFYDPGTFWSGDHLELERGARLGDEIPVHV